MTFRGFWPNLAFHDHPTLNTTTEALTDAHMFSSNFCIYHTVWHRRNRQRHVISDNGPGFLGKWSCGDRTVHVKRLTIAFSPHRRDFRHHAEDRLHASV